MNNLTITLKLEVPKQHLEWAAYMLIINQAKLSKKAIMEYLKEQYTLFGTDNVSLMGEEKASFFELYFEDLDLLEEDLVSIQKAKEWIAKKYEKEKVK